MHLEGIAALHPESLRYAREGTEAGERRLQQVQSHERGEQVEVRAHPVAECERGEDERAGDAPDDVVHRHSSSVVSRA